MPRPPAARAPRRRSSRPSTPSRAADWQCPDSRTFVRLIASASTSIAWASATVPLHPTVSLITAQAVSIFPIGALTWMPATRSRTRATDSRAI